MGKPKPSACSLADRVVTAQVSARHRAAPQKVRGFGELKCRCATHLLELTKQSDACVTAREQTAGSPRAELPGQSEGRQAGQDYIFLKQLYLKLVLFLNSR